MQQVKTHPRPVATGKANKKLANIPRLTNMEFIQKTMFTSRVVLMAENARKITIFKNGDGTHGAFQITTEPPWLKADQPLAERYATMTQVRPNPTPQPTPITIVISDSEEEEDIIEINAEAEEYNRFVSTSNTPERKEKGEPTPGPSTKQELEETSGKKKKKKRRGKKINRGNTLGIVRLPAYKKK